MAILIRSSHVMYSPILPPPSLSEEGKKMTPSEWKEATATEMVSLRAFAVNIIAQLFEYVNIPLDFRAILRYN